jgi:hypothetical protein
MFNWFPKNTIRIGLGLIQAEGCPPSYARPIRENPNPNKLPNPPLQPTAEKRGG